MKSLAIAMAFSAVSLASAGVVYEIEVKDHEQSPPKTQVMKAAVQGKHVKVEILSEKGAPDEIIFNAEKRELVVVDHEKGTYMVIDQAAVEEIAGQVNAAMSQVEAALQHVPEGQRDQMRAILEQNMPKNTKNTKQTTKKVPRRVFTPTGEKARKQGYRTEGVSASLEGDHVADHWVADFDQVEGGDEMRSAFAELGRFFVELTEAFSSFSSVGGAGFADMGELSMSSVDELGGIPVESTEFRNGTVVSTSVLRSAKKTKLGPEAFEPDPTYKRQRFGPS